MLIPAGHSSIGNFQELLEWHKMSPMVRVRENFLAEVNIQWNPKEKRMQREEDSVLVLAMGNGDRLILQDLGLGQQTILMTMSF